MKPAAVLLLVAVAAGGWAQSAPATPASSDRLTLEDALRIAESNAFAVRTADARVERTRQTLSGARANYGPRLSTSLNYTRFDQATTSNFGGGTITTQPIDSTTLGASLQIPVDLNGAIGFGIRAAEASYRAQVESRRAALNDLRRDVRRAYYNVLSADAQVTVAEQSLNLALERASVTEKLFQEAQVAKIDVDRAKVLVAQTQAGLEAAKLGAATSRFSLNQTLARPIDTPVAPVPITEAPKLNLAIESLIESAQQNRPEVLGLQQSLRALEAVRRTQEVALKPGLNVALNFQRNAGELGAFGGRRNTGTGVIGLTWQIWDSGRTRVAVKAARQDEEELRITLEQTKSFISLEVRSQVRAFETAIAQLEAARRQRALAEEVLRIAIVRQQAGEATPLEIVDAQTSLTQARTNEVTSLYNAFIGFAELQRSLGLELEQLPTSPAGGKRL